MFPISVWWMTSEAVEIGSPKERKYHKQRPVDIEQKEDEVNKAWAEQLASHNLGGPFQLMNAKTKKLMTEKELFEGKWTLLYFGFSKCAEVCPNTMKFLTEVVETSEKKLKVLHPKKLEQLQIAFISVDHVRDDPKTLSQWISKYPKTVGLCGTKDQVAKATGAWRVYFSSVDETETEAKRRESAGVAVPSAKDDSYQLDHSSAVYLVGPDGKLKDFFFKELGATGTVERIAMHFDNLFGLNAP